MAGLEAELARDGRAQLQTCNPPAQVGAILFEEMGLEGGKKTKTGAWSTPRGAGDLATEHDFAARVLDYRPAGQAEIDLYRRAAGSYRPRYRPGSYVLRADRGPIPAGSPRPIRTCRTFPSAPRKAGGSERPSSPTRATFWSPSTIRRSSCAFLAHVAGIEALKQAFHDGQDIHAATASEMFNVPLEQMTPDVRRQAKAINFGVIYGDFRLWPGAQPAHPPGRGAGFHRTAISNGFRAFAPIWTRPSSSPGTTAMSRPCSAARSTRPRSMPRGPAPGSPAARRSMRRSRARPPM